METQYKKENPTKKSLKYISILKTSLFSNISQEANHLWFVTIRYNTGTNGFSG